MLFIIGVLALAATIAVFALPVVLVVLIVRASRTRRISISTVDARSIAPTPDGFEELVRRNWPDEIIG